MIKIGHRGACGYKPENTLASFQKAIDLGVDMIECDVWLTKDKKIVVIHDHTVNRTTNGRGKVKNFTLEGIQKLDAGLGEKIPSLLELFDLAKNKCQLNIEVKTKRVAKYLVEEIKNCDFPFQDLLVSSKYIKTIKLVKNKIPSLKTAWVFKPLEKPWQQLVWGMLMKLFLPIVQSHLIKSLTKNNIEILNLYYPLTSKGLVNKLHKINKQIFVWTVNRRRSIKKMKRLGVDGIFSNYPNRLV